METDENPYDVTASLVGSGEQTSMPKLIVLRRLVCWAAAPPLFVVGYAAGHITYVFAWIAMEVVINIFSLLEVPPPEDPDILVLILWALVLFLVAWHVIFVAFVAWCILRRNWLAVCGIAFLGGSIIKSTLVLLFLIDLYFLRQI